MTVLTEASLAKCLKNDDLFRQSFGIKLKHSALKVFWMFMGGTFLLFLITPLPEMLFIGRFGILVGILGSSLSVWIDWLSYQSRILEAATRVYGIFNDDPALEVEKIDDDTYKLQHKKFEAQCSNITQLHLKEMLEQKEYIFDILGKKPRAQDEENPDTDQSGDRYPRVRS